MRARLRGGRAARGDVLLFLDAHCECGEDWLRPLLQRIKHKSDVAVTPLIDVLDQTTFQLDAADVFQAGEPARADRTYRIGRYDELHAKHSLFVPTGQIYRKAVFRANLLNSYNILVLKKKTLFYYAPIHLIPMIQEDSILLGKPFHLIRISWEYLKKLVRHIRS